MLVLIWMCVMAQTLAPTGLARASVMAAETRIRARLEAPAPVPHAEIAARRAAARYARLAPLAC